MRKRILERLAALYDRPVIQNNLRRLYVEFLVGELLGRDRKTVGSDWMSWDLEGSNGERVEVKQSAAKQTWPRKGNKASTPGFNIAPKAGYWSTASDWVEEPGRPAELYIFCWHPVAGDHADHREAEQWRFFVVPSNDLPDQQSIGLGPLRKRVPDVGASELPSAVARALEG